jgi:hypothetical protein
MRYLRINGIYDQNTIQFLKNLGVHNFAFDLRPISMNFVQSHKIATIIEQTFGLGDRYALQFGDDKDFVINGVLDKLNPVIAREELVLDFCSSRELLECESFKLPFIWHYNQTEAQDFLYSKKLHTIVFDQALIQQLELSNKLYPFMDSFFKKCPSHVQVEIAMDWSSSVMHTLIDFFPVNGLVLTINNQVEKQFRHVNLQLVQQHIELTKQSLES